MRTAKPAGAFEPAGGSSLSKTPGKLFATISVVALALLALMGCRHQPVGAKLSPFTFVQMCDPQIGFTDYAEDLRRFQDAVKQINLLRPDLVTICGDLVNAANERSFGDFKAAKASFTVPSYAAPGNHDIGNSPTRSSLQLYRRMMGRDYYRAEHKGCSFVVLNSQLWKTPVRGETEKQDRWLEHALRTAAQKHRRVFVIMHHPLFVKDAYEPDNYFNLPLGKRRELLGLFERSGVVAVLAGHTHATARHDYRGIQFVTSESTSRNFDNRPYGFRVWHVGTERPYRNEFVPLAD